MREHSDCSNLSDEGIGKDGRMEGWKAGRLLSHALLGSLNTVWKYEPGYVSYINEGRHM